MPIEKLRPEWTDFDHTLQEIRNILPEAFADGRINWTVLRELLNDILEDEELPEEHFGLFWPGKREARKLANKPSTGTLVPAPGEGVDEAQTEMCSVKQISRLGGADKNLDYILKGVVRVFL